LSKESRMIGARTRHNHNAGKRTIWLPNVGVPKKDGNLLC
jgi:hypothetical protein